MAQKPAKQVQKPVKLDFTLDPTQQANINANEEATAASMTHIVGWIGVFQLGSYTQLCFQCSGVISYLLVFVHFLSLLLCCIFCKQII